MTRQQKLLTAIRNNPKAVKFADACKVAEQLGFAFRNGKGSHCVYGKSGEPVILNFQNRGGYIPAYQARQLIEMMDKYETEIPD